MGFGTKTTFRCILIMVLNVLQTYTLHFIDESYAYRFRIQFIRSSVAL